VPAGFTANVHQSNTARWFECWCVYPRVAVVADSGCGCALVGLAGGLAEVTLLCLSRSGLSYSSIDIVRLRSILCTLCIGTDDTAPQHNSARLALGRAHTSANAAHVAKSLLLNKRRG